MKWSVPPVRDDVKSIATVPVLQSKGIRSASDFSFKYTPVLLRCFAFRRRIYYPYWAIPSRRVNSVIVFCLMAVGVGVIRGGSSFATSSFSPPNHHHHHHHHSNGSQSTHQASYRTRQICRFFVARFPLPAKHLPPTASKAPAKSEASTATKAAKKTAGKSKVPLMVRRKSARKPEGDLQLLHLQGSYFSLS